MPFSNRPGYNHGVLVVFEAVGVFVWAVTAVAALFLAEGAYSAVGIVGELAGEGPAAAEYGRIAVSLALGLLLVLSGALAVAGYRRAFEALFEELRPLSMAIAPAIGIVAPLGYVAATTGRPPLPLRAFAIVAVAAHALAYRLLAVESTLDGRERTTALVGSVASVPAAATFVTHADRLPVVGNRVVVETLQATVAVVPLDRSALIAVPLLITVGYGVRGGAATDGTSPSIADRVADVAAPARLGRLLKRSSKPATRKASESSGVASKLPGRGRSDGSSGSQARSPTQRVVVPSSPSTARSSSRKKAESRTADENRSETSEERGSEDEADDEERTAGAPDETSATDEPDAERAADPAESAPFAAEAPADERPSTEGTGSDTRIFVDDFDRYDDDPATSCPDCNQEMPSDGSYTFCPFCGCQL